MVSFSLILVSASLPLVSAEIIWSLPTEVPFYIDGNNTFPNQTLIINIISPQSKTYKSETFPMIVPLKVVTNLNASCYYSLDNSNWVSLGKNLVFERSLSVNKGSHTLTVWCRAGNQESVKSVNFKSIDKSSFNNSYTKDKLAEEEEYERNLKTNKYGEWICIDKRLQRTVTINGLQDVEYGQICGFELGASDREKINLSILIIIPLIFLILILIVITLIALAISRD